MPATSQGAAQGRADLPEDRQTMRVPTRPLPLLAALALIALVPACAPQNTGSTVSASAMGGAAHVSYGTIVGSRPVQVQGSGRGVGTIGGAVAGGVAGSFIGGDWRSNALAGLGGALLGGLAGNAIEGGVTRGTAIEFIVREDRGGDIAVVQTNEEGLQVNDRVVITRGDRVRLSRAAGGPPPGAYVPPQGAYAPPGYAPQVSPVGGPAK
jgi:outer membrane lipoprotein SlyB